MYKKLHNLSLKHLIKIRSHLGHKNNILNTKINPYIYGTRHNINIFDIEKL
jgi:ribosomal protein S2